MHRNGDQAQAADVNSLLRGCLIQKTLRVPNQPATLNSMSFDDKDKAALIASITASPLLIEVLQMIPPSKRDEPKELAETIVILAQNIIAVAEQKIP
jgi:hypothetical protein